jgi:hypothetical protein
MLEICALHLAFFSNLASSICALRSTYCIFGLYDLYSEPNFYEVYPRQNGPFDYQTSLQCSLIWYVTITMNSGQKLDTKFCYQLIFK